MDKLNIKVDLNNVGRLVKENDEFIFLYTSENIKDFISLIMPVRQKPYIHNKLHPIFEMHLPEGYLLSIIKKHFSKLLKTDDFGLLNIMAPSIKGRVSYESDFLRVETNLTLDDLLHSKNDNLFDELLDRFALNSALSGVQPKVLATVENKATLKIDDYIVKPYHPGEVVARVQAVLRRSNKKETKEEILRWQSLEVDVTAIVASIVDGNNTPRTLDLTPTEFSLLTTLMRSPSRPFSRQHLLEHCLPESEALERVVDTHIYNLRKKLEAAGISGVLVNVRGVGYRFRQP